MALFYLGAKGMIETMFLHFVPVDGVKFFSGICWRERYVFVFLCFQKTSLWTRPKNPVFNRGMTHQTKEKGFIKVSM